MGGFTPTIIPHVVYAMHESRQQNKISDCMMGNSVVLSVYTNRGVLDMVERTVDELAKELADMKWGDSLFAKKVSANEAHELGKAFLELRQQLEAKQQNDDWIEWHGGDCPVSDDTLVVVKYRNQQIQHTRSAECYDWSHGYGDMKTTSVDIVAYRIV